MKQWIKITPIIYLLFIICNIVLFRPAPGVSASEGADVLVHKVIDIDGKEVDLSEYRGNVLMIINVASKCGLTPQYEDLVAIHKKYRDKGFKILAFPANNFMGQEPGSNKEIKKFCRTNFNVEFKMFSKISVKGDDIAPLYRQLTSREENGTFGGDIKWNFDKFIVGRSGKVVARFDPPVKPTSGEVIAVIEKEIAKKD